MNRDAMLDRASEQKEWDIVVIGGGATGLATAVDAVSRGLSCILVEANDFAKATSSRSTKLVHGGVRYLQQRNFKLVAEALHERKLLLRNASDLVHPLSFAIPCYRWWQRPFYGSGLMLYDYLAGKSEFASSKWLSTQSTVERIPTIADKDLRGSILYSDGQFDDARLAIAMAQTAAREGGTLINYAKVESLRMEGGKVVGVEVVDMISQRSFTLNAKVVVNATGIFVDSIRSLQKSNIEPLVAYSQGIHIVLDRDFLPGQTALMVPRTDDGRVLFAIPWHGKTVVGTTDTKIAQHEVEPKAKREEIDFLLSHAGRYLNRQPTDRDIRSIFVGIRPLVQAGSKEKKTSQLSRDHRIEVSSSGLLTITGGKWTTVRKMAQDVVDQAQQIGMWKKLQCQTETLKLVGSASEDIESLSALDRKLDEPMHKAFDAKMAQVVWSVRHEMAMRVEDVLARRTRLLFLDAAAASEAAPRVAACMASELGHDLAWQEEQVRDFRQLAQQYQAS